MAVYMAVGEYLNAKKAMGQLTGFDLDAAIKQIQEGDTNTVFALGEGSLTPEQRLNVLIDYLINGRSDEAVPVQENGVVSAQRKALERLWKDRCTVYHRIKVKDP